MFARLSLSNKSKKRLTFLLKLLLSALALAIVYSKLDPAQILKIIKSINPFWVILAIILFNLSKVLSAFRLNHLFQAMGLTLENIQNLRLYYIGMFYNLFLPGGIGGDAYKIYLLKKHAQSRVKLTTIAVLVDRFSGMMAIVLLIGLLLLGFLNLSFSQSILITLSLGLFLMYPLFYFVIARFIPEFKPVFLKINAYGFAVQLAQVLCALSILKSMSVVGLWPEYVALFLFSSIVTIVPVTIGGLGARELAFLWGHELLHVDISVAISLSLLFFVITALSSLVGVFLRFEEKSA